MKAINLIPPEQRRGGSGPGRSGGAVFIVLGAVGFVVIAAALYVLSANTVTNHQHELTKLQAQTQTAQARANALSPYKQFESLKQSRVATIQQLAKSRFDWERVMRKLAIVIPPDVWLTSLHGTVSPDVNAGGGGGSTGSDLRGAMPVPAVELVGCTTGQAQVSRFMSRLRAIDGVTRVSLSSSEKQDSSGGTGDASSSGSSSGGSSTASGTCGGGTKGYPQFNMVIFFGGSAQAAPGVGSASGGGAPAPASQPGAANTNTASKGSK